MKCLSTVIVGMGERGKVHLHGFLENRDMFEVKGICDRRDVHLQESVKQYGISPDICYADAEEMLKTVKPDVMAFVTMPHIRLPLVKLAVKYKVKGLLFEKPMAVSLEEADEIVRLCEAHEIKTIVCHQHKYLNSFLELKKTLDSGELGQITDIRASCQPQASQLGTHYLDYMIWANEGKQIVSCVGHIHGSFYLEDSHPSPDYVMGQFIFENGVRGLLECGYWAKQTEMYQAGFSHGSGEPAYWTDDRLMVYGSAGYAWASCNGKYAVFSPETSPEIRQGDYQDFFKREQFEAQVRYTKEFGEWMMGKREGHDCDVKLAYHGFEVLEGIYSSALDCTRVDFPLILPRKYEALEECRKRLHRVNYRQWR